jgi:hypothetical protein
LPPDGGSKKAGGSSDASVRPASSDASSGDASLASKDAGGATSNDTCPDTSDYNLEFEEYVLYNPECGPGHGGDCADPAQYCCYFDRLSNGSVCLPWIDGG